MAEKNPQQPAKIFCCYANEDRKYVDELWKHLSLLERNGMIARWTKQELCGTTDWKNTLNKDFNDADIVLLMLSPDFINSYYSSGRQMQKAIEDQRRGQKHILPVILRPISYGLTPFNHLKPLPSNEKPVVSWSRRDDAYVDILENILVIIKSFPSRENLHPSLNSREEQVYDEIEVQQPSLLSFWDEVEDVSYKTQVARKKSASSGKGKRDFNVVRKTAYEYYTKKQFQNALRSLETINLVPEKQRWRIAALRGHCYFGLGRFLLAKREYMNAISGKPIVVSRDELPEELELYVRSADTERELGNIEEAIERYQKAFATIDPGASLNLIADAHWGMALALFEQVSSSIDGEELYYMQLQDALKHAETARGLYETIGEGLEAVSITCDIALMEKAAGNLNKARAYLQEVLSHWLSESDNLAKRFPTYRNSQNGYNSVLAAAFCYLADIELAAGKYDMASSYIQQAEDIAQECSHLWKSEVFVMRGRLLEAQDLHSARAEEAYHLAIKELSSTDHYAALIRVHETLGKLLLKRGDYTAGEKELDKARILSLRASFQNG